MKVYTKNGDSGKTGLLNDRVSKTNPRIELNGQIDELMVSLAFLIEDIKKMEDGKISTILKRIYKNLFTITSMIADIKKQSNYKLNNNEINILEKEIDEMSLSLPKLRNFIYYTGNDTAIMCHKIRAKTRTVERWAVRLYEEEEIENNILSYLNRLSDYFYTLARYINFINDIEEESL